MDRVLGSAHHRIDPPETLAGLLSVTLVAVFLVLFLVVGYPRLKPWTIQKRNQGEDQSLNEDFR